MLDIKLLRDDPEMVRKSIAAKNANPALVDDFLESDNEWRALREKLDKLRARQNEFSKERKIDAAKKNKEEVRAAELRIAEIEKERDAVWAKIPNLPDDDVPVGKSEAENKVLRKWGEPPKFDFEPKDHLELGERLHLIDIERAAKVSGARFGYLFGDSALLEFALVKLAFDTLGDKKILKSIAEKIVGDYPAKPFLPVVPPVMITPDAFSRMARLEPKEERYFIPSDNLYLVGSAEHTMGTLHMDETISEENLPLRYVGFSTAFRREAGSYGKDTRGLLRVHQFDKVEIESFTKPEDSRREQDFIVGIQEYLMQLLKIPYRVVAISTGDMGGPDARQIDIESWMPGENQHRETHTSDMMTDYQARRLGTKVKYRSGKTEFAHMNDATVFAIGRTLIAILENYQRSDGKIDVPEVLQKYAGKKVIG